MELVVVMGIMAMLLALGVGGLISARNSSEVDAVAEDLVSTIRQAQNNAISINGGSDCKKPTGGTAIGMAKVWGVVVVGPSYQLVYRCYTDDGGNYDWEVAKSYTSPYPGVNLLHEIRSLANGIGDASVRIWFTAPQGRGWVNFNENPIDTITWWSFIPSGLQSKEFIPNTANVGDPHWLQNSDTYTIKVIKNGYSRNIVIKSNGDVYEE